MSVENILLVTACLIIFSVIILILLIRNKKIKDRFEEKVKEVEACNKDIQEHLNTAKMVQKVLFSTSDEIKKGLPRHFILNSPSQHASGDFCSFFKWGNRIYIAVADCTGHGVIGSFMSLLGTSILKDTICQFQNASSNEILREFRTNFMNSLSKSGLNNEYYEGIDIAFCIFDTTTNELQYSGAHNPLVLIREKEITEYKADKIRVGILPFNNKQDFKRTDLKLKKGDMIYLFTDGFQDQFGSEHKRKYSRKRLNELLLSICQKPLNEQLNELESAFNSWKGSYRQVDDVLVLGFRIE